MSGAVSRHQLWPQQGILDEIHRRKTDGLAIPHLGARVTEQAMEARAMSGNVKQKHSQKQGLVLSITLLATSGAYGPKNDRLRN